MSDLKSQVTALLKKCPNHACSFPDGAHASYFSSNNVTYDIELFKTGDNDEHDCLVFNCTLSIIAPAANLTKNIELTEKEFMDLKWKIEDWASQIESKLLEDFAEFAEAEQTSMDQLLDD